MKTSFRAALAVGALALASSQTYASSVPDATLNVYDGMAASTLYTGALATPAVNPFIYELNVSDANGATITVTFGDTLLDAGPIPGSVTYELFNDLTSGTGSVTQGSSLMTALTFVDPVGGSFTKFLGFGEYVLKLTHAGSGAITSSSTISAVPLPAAAWLFGSALMGFGALRRKQKSGEKSEMAAA